MHIVSAQQVKDVGGGIACNWYVLYTRSRHEKLVESELIRKGFEAFTPTVTIRRRWSDRIQFIKEPLFKSYCFARFDLFNKERVLSQRGVVDLVHFKQHYIPVESSVIVSLKTLTLHHVPLDPYPYIKEGSKVFIRRGPLRGVEGFVVEKRNKCANIVISIDIINSSVRCVVDSDCIELA